MSVADVSVVLRKELRETLRDRRTVAVMVLLPLVVYPVMSLLVTEVMASKQMADEARPSRVELFASDPAAAGAARAALGRSKEIALAPPPDSRATVTADADVAAGRIDAAVVVDAAVGQAPRRAWIVHDPTREPSVKALGRIEAALSAALPPGCAPSYAVAARSVAGKQKVGAYVLSKVLPLLVVVMTMLGAFYPAIDITAGERERGTLETLLSTPVRRMDLLLGKVLAVTVLAALTGILNIASMSLTVVATANLGGAAGALVIPWTRAAATVLCVVPAAFLFAALMVAIGALARSFKEAQNLLAPLYFLCLTPSLVAALGDFPLTGATLVAPGVNLTLLARDLMIAAASPGRAAVVLASTLAYAALAVALAARLYDSERFLAAADGEHVPLGAHLRRLLGRGQPAGEQGAGARGTDHDAGIGAGDRDDAPSPAHALVLFAVAFVLWFFLFAQLQRWRVIPGLLLSQWGGFGGLVWLYARLRGRRVREVIALHRPSPFALVGATLLGLSAWVLLGFLAERLFPPPRELVEEMRRLIRPPGGDRPLAVSLLALALTPAICEEALFRGPILRGLAHRLSVPAACLITGVLFGALHGDVWRFVPTSLLGALLAWMTLTSGSILPAMLTHFVNNGALVVLGYFGLDDPARPVSPRLEIWLVAGASVALVLGVAAVRAGRPKSAFAN